MTRGSCLTALLLTLFSFVLYGCSEPAPAGIPHTHHPEAEVTLCGLCGEIKGGEKCCKEGVAKCPKCGLHKGSILCCSTAFNGAPRDVILCSKCGEKAFTNKCCESGVTGVAICPKCGLHKGSPGCCKIEKFTGDDAGHGVAHAHQGGHS